MLDRLFKRFSDSMLGWWTTQLSTLHTAGTPEPQNARHPHSDHTKIDLTDLRMRMRNAPIAVVKSTTALSGLA